MLISEDCLICEEYISKMQRRRVFTKFTSLNSKIALQVARKIAPCDMAFSLVLHSPGGKGGRLCVGDLGDERGRPTLPLLFGVTSDASFSLSAESESSVI